MQDAGCCYYDPAVDAIFAADELTVNPASVQPVEVVAAGCSANQFGNLTESGFGNMQAAQPCGNRRSVLGGSGRLAQWSGSVIATVACRLARSYAPTCGRRVGAELLSLLATGGLTWMADE